MKKARALGYVRMERHLTGEQYVVIKGELSSGFTYVVVKLNDPHDGKGVLKTLSQTEAETEFHRLEAAG